MADRLVYHHRKAGEVIFRNQSTAMRQVLSWFCATLGLYLELQAVRFWLHGDGLIGLVVHLGASLLMGIALGQQVRAWGLWAAAMSFTMPGVGPLLVALAWIPSGLRGAPAEETELVMAEFREHTRPIPEPRPPTPHSFEEQMAAHMTTASSLSQSEADARSVRLLADSLTSGADAGRVRRLRALLTDPQSDSYHVAAAKLARLQEHYTVSLYEASQKAQAFPGSVELQAALAEGYVDYLRSGLLDGQFSEFYYGLAVQRFEILTQLEKDEPVWRLRIAELHRRNGKYDEALATCESILQQWPENSEARMRILEIYYYGARRGIGESTRQFVGMLKRLKDEIHPEQIEDPSLQESAQWWFRRA